MRAGFGHTKDVPGVQFILVSRAIHDKFPIMKKATRSGRYGCDTLKCGCSRAVK